jgi:hypothetical protein
MSLQNLLAAFKLTNINKIIPSGRSAPSIETSKGVVWQGELACVLDCPEIGDAVPGKLRSRWSLDAPRVDDRLAEDGLHVTKYAEQVYAPLTEAQKNQQKLGEPVKREFDTSKYVLAVLEDSSDAENYRLLRLDADRTWYYLPAAGQTPVNTDSKGAVITDPRRACFIVTEEKRRRFDGYVSIKGQRYASLVDPDKPKDSILLRADEDGTWSYIPDRTKTNVRRKTDSKDAVIKDPAAANFIISLERCYRFVGFVDVKEVEYTPRQINTGSATQVPRAGWRRMVDTVLEDSGLRW